MSGFSKDRRQIIRNFCERSGKYTPDAYEFVTTGVIEQVQAMEEPRHLSALEVLQNLRDQLLENFGLLAPAVLKEWNIRQASDIGEIVFDLIEMQILSASEDDKRSDFNIEFDLPVKNNCVKRSMPAEVPKID